MSILSDREIELFKQLIQDEFGGELVSLDQDSKTFVFSFKSQDKMLFLISALKSEKRLARAIRINSKIVDGKNLLTIDPH